MSKKKLIRIQCFFFHKNGNWYKKIKNQLEKVKDMEFIFEKQNQKIKLDICPIFLILICKK